MTNLFFIPFKLECGDINVESSIKVRKENSIPECQGASKEIHPGVLTSFKDRLRQLEEELQCWRNNIERLNRQNELILNSTGEGIFGLDRKGIITFVNPAAAKILGYGTRELIGRRSHSTWHHTKLGGSPYPEHECPLCATIKDGLVHRVEEDVFWKKDGTAVLVEYVSTPIKERYGLTGAVITFKDITSQKRLENEIKEKVKFEKLVTGISTRFIKLGPGEVDRGISRALKEIGTFVGVDRSYLFLFSEDRTIMSNTHEWCAKGISPQILTLQDIPITDLPWIMGRLLLYKKVHIPDIAGLPPEALTEKEHFLAQGIKSIMAVPLIYKNLIYGFLGLDSVRGEKRWPEETIKLIRIVGEIFVSALVRCRAEEGLQAKNQELLSTVLQLSRAKEELKKQYKELQNNEKLIRGSEEKFRTLFNKANDCIFLIKLSGDGTPGPIIEANDIACRKLGYSKDQFLSMTTGDIMSEEYLDEVSGIWRQCMDQGRASFEIEQITRSGERIPMEINTHVFTLNGEKVALSIARDITERKQAEKTLQQSNEELEATIEELNVIQDELRQNYEKFRYLSLHDSLTGLFNRTYFEEEVLRLERGRYNQVSVIVCDVDGLKFVNDSFGHDYGDALLIAAANTIKECFREGDVVARIGGDEFAILLPNTDYASAEVSTGRLKDLLERYNSVNAELPLSISVGFATNDPGKGVGDIFKEADNNMYREKLHRVKSTRSAIVQALMKALEARDYITEGHADRLKWMVADLARIAGLTESSITDLRLLAQFHDIGKVGIPDRILFKSSSLTADEFSEMKRHCEIGHRIAQAAPDLSPIADWILKHHEWWNGGGYPLKLQGEDIPLECRIISIVDAYDAMTSDRPYRKALTHDEALSELSRFAGIQFDPSLVEKFAQLF